MLLRKPAYLFAAVLPAILLFAHRVKADDLATNALVRMPPFRVSIVNEAVPNMRPFPRVYVTAGTNKLALLAPDGFRIDASSPGKILFTSADYSYYFTFRIAGPMPADSNELKAESYREKLLSSYPGAKIQREFSISAGGHSGPAFDLQWRNSGGVMQIARVAFIPSAAGVLEFSLVTRPDKFEEGQYAFNTLLLTFRTNEKGKLEIVYISGSS